MRGQRTRATIVTVIIWVGFALYLAFLLKLLLLSRPVGSERSINLIPFTTILEYVRGGSRFAFANVAGNVLAFVPLGAYLPALRRQMPVGRNLLIIAASSVAVEIVQGLFGLGSSDIDDVILNTAGGLIGILAVLLLRTITRGRMPVRSLLVIPVLLSIPVLGWLLFSIRLHM